MLTPSPRSRLLPAALAMALLAAPAAARADGLTGGGAYVPGEVVVRYEPDADGAARAEVQRDAGVDDPRAIAAHSRVVKIRDGGSVAETVRELRERPEVSAAAPNPIARISAYVPPDPGNSSVSGGWQALQWNFLPDTGVGAPDAWQHLLDAGHPGGRGVVVAVLDTGVAYRNAGRCVRRVRCRRSPDLGAEDFAPGYDFVTGDRRPDDENGHGTHVASTIGEKTGNTVGLTGLAYGARIMPVRVLDRFGEGDSVAISAGIRYAARHRADIINLSFEFDGGVSRSQIPNILEALRFARRRGVLVVGASGNASARAIAYPARADDVLSVGATTEHRCQADYSNKGADLDLSAPGGGADADLPQDANCRPDEPSGRNIFQVTFRAERAIGRFGIPTDYKGTSMAAPHVSATAALVIASGVLGPKPSVSALQAHLKATTQDLGRPGPDSRYGYGLIDADRATDPAFRSSG